MRCPACAAAAAGIMLAGVAFSSVPVVATVDLKISNGAIKATLSGAGLGLTKLEEENTTVGASVFALGFTGDSWQVNVSSVAEATTRSSLLLSPSSCSSFAATTTSNSSATYTYECAQAILPSPPSRTIPVLFRVVATYELLPGAEFVTKTISIGTTVPWSEEQGLFRVESIAPLGPGLEVKTTTETTEYIERANPFANGLEIAGFLRFPKLGRGAFVSVANPWAKYSFDEDNAKISAIYVASMEHRPSALTGDVHVADPVVLGFTSISKYYSSATGLSTSESRAFRNCVSHFLLDWDSRKKNGAVKVNVAWDENDYQIDVGTESGRTEYKRIIDRNSELGVTHIVYEPRNTLHATRFNSTDGWGWEASLWFGLGEMLREGVWNPAAATDAFPEDITDMVSYARSKNVSLLAYVYPCLAFQRHAEAVVGGALDLSAPGVADWMSLTLTAFMRRSGAGGFAWDHNIYAGDASKRYSQWRAWMRILKKLREDFPDIVMDHRQTAHMWGPWYQLAGSYTEPIAGDENPETYGVPIASLHTDHVAADNTRIINHRYSDEQLIPAARIPGFMFHQTERTADNGTSPCFGSSKLCYDNNARDFDLLGFKYSVISNVGTAGMNNILTFIPARDIEEFDLVPAVGAIDFIRSWIDFTDEYGLSHLAHTAPIPTLAAPSLGNVDGTSAVDPATDSGFVFLFNPNMIAMKVKLHVDESIGISNASVSSTWGISELYPRRLPNISSCSHGDEVEVNVSPSEALVLQFEKRGAITMANNVKVMTLMGQAQTTERVYLSPDIAKMQRCNFAPSASGEEDGILLCDVTFGSSKSNSGGGGGGGSSNVTRMMPLLEQAPSKTNTGGNFSSSFTIPQAVFDQLEARNKTYPIKWQDFDTPATWLVPGRLLAYVFVAEPKDSWGVSAEIDGKPVEIKKSYNSRGRVVPSCFLGFYFELSPEDVTPDREHQLSVSLPANLPAGAFQGVFLENVETEYSEVVERCECV